MGELKALLARMPEHLARLDALQEELRRQMEARRLREHRDYIDDTFRELHALRRQWERKARRCLRHGDEAAARVYAEVADQIERFVACRMMLLPDDE